MNKTCISNFVPFLWHGNSSWVLDFLFYSGWIGTTVGELGAWKVRRPFLGLLPQPNMTKDWSRTDGTISCPVVILSFLCTHINVVVTSVNLKETDLLVESRGNCVWGNLRKAAFLYPWCHYPACILTLILARELKSINWLSIRTLGCAGIDYSRGVSHPWIWPPPVSDVLRLQGVRSDATNLSTQVVMKWVRVGRCKRWSKGGPRWLLLHSSSPISLQNDVELQEIVA